jgi:hypothetical protein
MRAGHKVGTPLWMWREDWASGRIREQRGSWALVSWFLLLLTLALGLQVSASLSPDDGFSRHVLIALVPLLVSGGLLVAALRGTWQRLRYGIAELVLDEIPVTSGGRVLGHVHIPSRAVDRRSSGFVASLASIRIVTVGTGRRNAPSNLVSSTLWCEERRVRPCDVRVRDQIAGVPVSFALPNGLPPTGSGVPGHQVIWQLELRRDNGPVFAASAE